MEVTLLNFTCYYLLFERECLLFELKAHNTLTVLLKKCRIVTGCNVIANRV
jgi:hypothetical protein